MASVKPTSKNIHLSLILLLLFGSSFLFVNASFGPETDHANENDDLTEIEELIAVDEQEEQQEHQHEHESFSDAKVLSKAQRIVNELNSDSTKKVIDENEYVFIIGYAPWCPRSAELMPQFAEAANLLKEVGSPVLMAKLDADRYPKAASSLEINGFPTLLLFTNGTSQPYTGGFTAEDMVLWVRKKTGEPVARLTSVSEAEVFVKKHTIFVVGLFEKFEGSQYDEFIRAASSDNEIQFVETISVEVAKHLFPDMKSSYPFIGLVKSEPERFTTFEESVDKESILKFLENNKFPLVTILTELNANKVYSSSFKLQLYVFAEADEFKNLLEPLQEVARNFKSEIMFIYADIKEENLAKPFLSMLGLEESKETVVGVFDNKISTKYLLEAKPEPSKIQEFCHGILSGTVSPYYKSQPVPDNTEATVQVVVGKTFDEVVLTSSKNVLLEVHTPWCLNCETTSKQVEKLAKHFKALDNLIFAKIDASVNEHPKLQVDDYPTLLFYPAADKANPIKLSTKSSLKELGAFIKKNTRADEHPTRDEL